MCSVKLKGNSVSERTFSWIVSYSAVALSSNFEVAVFYPELFQVLTLSHPRKGSDLQVTGARIS